MMASMYVYIYIYIYVPLNHLDTLYPLESIPYLPVRGSKSFCTREKKNNEMSVVCYLASGCYGQAYKTMTLTA